MARWQDEVAMDFGSPWAIVSSVVIGAVGMVLFARGKREVNVPQLVGGGAMCVYPIFITSVLLLWVIFAACVAGMYFLGRE
jgi:hypothetical protein